MFIHDDEIDGASAEELEAWADRLIRRATERRSEQRAWLVDRLRLLDERVALLEAARGGLKGDATP